MKHFDLVDGFISPSEFLRARYIAWGIEPERIVVMENGQSAEEPLPPRELSPGETRNRFGFFGQITPYKGLDVVLTALGQLKKAERKSIVLEVHGANLELQTEAFRAKIEALSQPLIKQGVVHWVGPYQPHELRGKMAQLDWVLVPSIWWENSPMVIQESFVYGRPLITSDIGGMAEKVADGIDGLHATAGAPFQWGRTLLQASRFTNRWDELRAGITRPVTHAASAKAHLNHMMTAST